MRGLRSRSRRQTHAQFVGLPDKHQADRRLRLAVEAGQLSQDEYRRRCQRVYQAVTPRDLWKASGGRSGSPRRSDWRELRHAILLQVSIIVFAAVAMLVILWGTIVHLRQQGSG